MSNKLKLTDSSGNPISTCPKITDVRPVGSLVLLELLTPQEALGQSTLMITEETVVGAPQAYILKLGPKVPEDFGFKAGDRVIVTPNFNPVTFCPMPEGWNKSGREVVATEYSSIKALCDEA